MQTNEFFPRSTRNRIAMVMGLLSLVLFITWNLLPIEEPSLGGTEIKTMATIFWPNIYQSLINIDTSNLSFDEVASAMATILVTLLALISFSLLPAWKLWQSSAIMRIIPAILMLIGFGIVLYFTTLDNQMRSSDMMILFTIATNFLTAAIALLLFKNESIDHPDHGISST